MRITYSTAAERAAAAASTRRSGPPALELVALFVASIVALTGVALVYGAKKAESGGPGTPPAPRVNINAVDRPEQLLPALEGAVADAAERRFVAERIAAWLTTPDGTGSARRRVSGLGALGSIRVSEADLGRNRRLPSFRQRLAGKRAGAVAGGPPPTVPLLTAAEAAALRPFLVVREWPSFRNGLLVACLLFLAGFYAPWALARVRHLSSDPLLLPAVHLLCGVGIAMMVSLRDPLRDAPLYMRFAEGVLVGGLALAAIRAVDLQRSPIKRLSYVPLLGAILLSALLIVFGSGPGSSDAKVNLFGVQPVEAIRVLVVLFLAGYFANRWELLRSLKEKGLERATRLGIDLPRLDYVVPVLVGMALVLAFFFLQKDLGPALVLACIFLAMYGVARRRLTMVGVGLLLLAAGFVGGYLVGFPHTVVQRVQMWASPWDNAVRGGDQVAHALWALAAGAATGTGPGLGDPQLVPAGHTDLILAVIGEELGFAGVLAVLSLFGLVTWRCLRIALRAPGDYTFFLALGLTLGIVLQLVLIASGLLGLMPLTGVATPTCSRWESSSASRDIPVRPGTSPSSSARRSCWPGLSRPSCCWCSDERPSSRCCVPTRCWLPRRSVCRATASGASPTIPGCWRRRSVSSGAPSSTGAVSRSRRAAGPISSRTPPTSRSSAFVPTPGAPRADAAIRLAASCITCWAISTARRTGPPATPRSSSATATSRCAGTTTTPGSSR